MYLFLLIKTLNRPNLNLFCLILKKIVIMWLIYYYLSYPSLFAVYRPQKDNYLMRRLYGFCLTWHAPYFLRWIWMLQIPTTVDIYHIIQWPEVGKSYEILKFWKIDQINQWHNPSQRVHYSTRLNSHPSQQSP